MRGIITIHWLQKAEKYDMICSASNQQWRLIFRIQIKQRIINKKKRKNRKNKQNKSKERKISIEKKAERRDEEIKEEDFDTFEIKTTADNK